MKATETTQVRHSVHTAKNSATVNARVSTAALALTSAAGLTIGVWSFAALAGALVTSGGPLSLASGYFRAVSGL